MTGTPSWSILAKQEVHNLEIISKEVKMNTTRDNTGTFENIKVNVKIKLSALWVTLMLFYIYADILGFYSPGVIEKVMSGKIGGVQVSAGFLLIMAIWMAVPSLMVYLSLTLKANANRWVNLIAGILSFLMLAATFFAGELSARYIFQAIVEGMLIVAIVWSAWSWPTQVRLEATA